MRLVQDYKGKFALNAVRVRPNPTASSCVSAGGVICCKWHRFQRWEAGVYETHAL